MIINPYAFGFNPLSLSPALWLDASDASTLYDATTGGNLVAANGVVKRWEDKSGNNRHVTEATNGPARKTAIQNGRDCLLFDGSNDTLSLGASIFTGSASRTMIAVYSPIRTTGTTQFICGQGGPANNNTWFQLQTRVSPAGNPYFAGYAADSTTGTAPSTGWKIATVTYNGTNVVLYREGAQVDSDARSLNTNNSPFYVGKSGIEDPANHYIGAVLVFPTALDSTALANIHKYLADWWGIPLA